MLYSPGYRPPPPKTYAYIDGSYLEHAYEDIWLAIYGADRWDLSFESLKGRLQAQRVFYYDALIEPVLPDNPTTIEKDRYEKDAAKAVLKKGVLERIQRTTAYHVRNGTARQRRRTKSNEPPIQQKEVDVLLAVECLANSFRGNTEHVVLIAGDLDLRPLVEELVRMGQFVTLYAEPKASSFLIDAADEFIPLDYIFFSDTNTNTPNRVYFVSRPAVWAPKTVRNGQKGNEEVLLLTAKPDVTFNDWHFYIDLGDNRYATCPDKENLESYARVDLGVEWQ